MNTKLIERLLKLSEAYRILACDYETLLNERDVLAAKLERLNPRKAKKFVRGTLWKN